MITAHLLQAVAYGLMILGQLYVFGKYVCQGLIAWRDRNKAEAAFLKEIKENHLKHIYETLRSICFYLNIPYEPPMP